MAIRKPEAWQVRKVGYGVVAVVVAILGYVGVLSEIQADEVTAQADQWIPIVLGALGPALASVKTGPGSDSTATYADVAAAAQIGATDAAFDVISNIDQSVNVGRHSLDERSSKIASVAGYYRGE